MVANRNAGGCFGHWAGSAGESAPLMGAMWHSNGVQVGVHGPGIRLLQFGASAIYRNPRALRPGVEPALIRDRAGVNGNRGWSLAGVVKISS